MSALPLTALRPLTFPSHRWAALVCLRTGRVLALVPVAPPDSRSVEACGAGASRSDEPVASIAQSAH